MKQLKVSGPIISNSDKWFYDAMDWEATCANDITKELDGSDLEILVNSYGGLVDVGNEIYTALKSYTGKIKMNVVMAGSAASIIAMAGDTVAISPVGQIMIHNVHMGAGGDYHDMDKASEILQKANESLASAYQIKTGKSKEEVLALMDKETWLTAEEAKENGFADEIMFETDEKAMLVANTGDAVIPSKVIAEVSRLKAQIKALEEQEKMNQTKKNVSPFAKFLF